MARNGILQPVFSLPRPMVTKGVFFKRGSPYNSDRIWKKRAKTLKPSPVRAVHFGSLATTQRRRNEHFRNYKFKKQKKTAFIQNEKLSGDK